MAERKYGCLNGLLCCINPTWCDVKINQSAGPNVPVWLWRTGKVWLLWGKEAVHVIEVQKVVDIPIVQWPISTFHNKEKKHMNVGREIIEYKPESVAVVV